MTGAEAKSRLKELAEGCTTPEEVRERVSQLPQDEKMQLIYATASDESFDEVKRHSLWFIDFCEKNGLINDYERGVGRQEPIVGVMLAATKMLQNQVEGMARRELQAQTESTQFGMQIANAISDRVALIQQDIEAISQLSCRYAAVLKGRQMDFDYLDDEGNGTPYSEERKLKKKLIFQEELEGFDRWREEQRQQEK